MGGELCKVVQTKEKHSTGRESSSFEPKTNGNRISLTHHWSFHILRFTISLMNIVSEAASGSFRKESQDYELDVGEGLYQAGKKAETVGKATINGGYTMARQYVRSWQDGTQTAFLQRCFDSLKNGDDLNAFVSHAKKAYNDTFTDRPQADLAPQPDITPPPTKGE
ncbi:uncharacterized protein BYT42DRAFT_243280 [Radiomyces spectabilis]|uniref:uncharacterized protein n=1 Tax=Radiomyces spectabilis TaxID=64574 RepID=UPI00221F4D9C|nr:uncharacterized protein BYT42DRAFT_243280 [Radiomyces spectabilis]KAI8388686.1 hypothetical protein BYT42DRAFT_243280 [Radiomyces spectabilis]